MRAKWFIIFIQNYVHVYPLPLQCVFPSIYVSLYIYREVHAKICHKSLATKLEFEIVTGLYPGFNAFTHSNDYFV